MMDHEYWMSIAINEARKSRTLGEIPVGAVTVKNNEIIAKSHNSVILDFDPTAHSEVNVIRFSARKLKNYRLKDITLYVTLEPCAMCYGAIIHSRISKVVFGAYDLKTGVCGSCMDIKKHSNCFNHYPEIIGGVLESECSKILKDFFKSKRS